MLLLLLLPQAAASVRLNSKCLVRWWSVDLQSHRAFPLVQYLMWVPWTARLQINEQVPADGTHQEVDLNVLMSTSDEVIVVRSKWSSVFWSKKTHSVSSSFPLWYTYWTRGYLRNNVCNSLLCRVEVIYANVVVMQNHPYLDTASVSNRIFFSFFPIVKIEHILQLPPQCMRWNYPSEWWVLCRQLDLRS